MSTEPSRKIKIEQTKTNIKIIDYAPELQTFFEKLNRQWIELYFEMEEADYQILQNPQTEVIDRGGAVLFAEIEDEEIVGTVALYPIGEDLELAKMAVAEKARGLGIGKLLGKAALERAKDLGYDSVFLYTNSVLKPAISLYRKLGFRQIPIMDEDKEYQRSDVKMIINL